MLVLTGVLLNKLSYYSSSHLSCYRKKQSIKQRCVTFMYLKWMFIYPKSPSEGFETVSFCYCCLSQVRNEHLHSFVSPSLSSSVCSGFHVSCDLMWSLPFSVCVFCFYKQNVEVTRMSEEALLTVPAHQWGSTPPTPHSPKLSLSLSHSFLYPLCTLQTHNSSARFSSLLFFFSTFFQMNLLHSTFLEPCW